MSISPQQDSLITYLFILSILDWILLKRLICNTLQIIHQRLQSVGVNTNISFDVCTQLFTCNGACK